MILEDDIITIPITHEMKLEALEQEKLIEKQHKGSKLSQNLNSRRNFYGALGEIVVRTYFESTNVEATFPQYFDASVTGDKYDFFHRGSVDVKTSPGDSSTNNCFLVGKHQKDKKIDYYCFVKIDKERQEGHIFGVIGYEDFWNSGNPSFKTPRMKTPAHMIRTEHLEPMREFVYGV